MHVDVKIINVKAGRRLNPAPTELKFTSTSRNNILSDKSYSKIFLAGFNRCGSSSFFELCSRLGLSAFQGQEQPYDPFLFTFDAFCDWHPTLDKVESLVNRPFDSCFIFNTRPAIDWMLSKHTQALILDNGQNMLTEESVAFWMKTRRKFFSLALEFSLNNDLRVCTLNIKRPNWGRYLCNWLGLTPLKERKRHDTLKRIRRLKLRRIRVRLDADKAEMYNIFRKLDLPPQELFFPGQDSLIESFPGYI